MVLHWRNAFIAAGGFVTVAGPSLTTASLIYEWRPLLGTAGLAFMIIGMLLVVTGILLRVNGGIGEIYRRGFEDGLRVGRKEGRRTGRPVVIDLEGARRERQPPSPWPNGKHARTP